MQREKFLTTRKVAELTTFSRSTIERKVRTGDFPEPIQISDRRKVWPESAVQNWIAQMLTKAGHEAA